MPPAPLLSIQGPAAVLRPLLLGVIGAALLAAAAHAQTASAPAAPKPAAPAAAATKMMPKMMRQGSCFDAPYDSQDWKTCQQMHPDMATKEHPMGQMGGMGPMMGRKN